MLYNLLIFCCLLAPNNTTDASTISSSPDTVPPQFSWTSPKPFAVLTTNTVRIAVDASDSGSGIDKIIFYATYFDYAGRINEKVLIGTVERPPYEFLWDCSHIPDQAVYVLSFHCEVTDKAGNKTFSPVWSCR